MFADMTHSKQWMTLFKASNKANYESPSSYPFLETVLPILRMQGQKKSYLQNRINL